MFTQPDNCETRKDSMELSYAIAGLVFLAFILSYYILTTKFGNPKNGKRTTPPTAGGAWPIIGHLLLMSGSSHEKLPHFTLAALVDKYGPIFNIRIGVHPALVVSNWKLVKEIFVDNDMAVLSRPPLIAAEHLGYDSAMFAFAPYGPYWREVRKLITVELLSGKRVEQLRHIRASEISLSTKELYQLWAEKKNGSGLFVVELKRWFGDLNLNVLVRMVAGKRYIASVNDGKAARCQEVLGAFFQLLGTFTPADALPFLRWLDLGGYEKRMKATGKEMDRIAAEWLEEHRRREYTDGSEQQDFMDMMLLLLRKQEGSRQFDFDADTIIKATCLGLIAGGSDSPTVMLLWILGLLLNNRHTLKKAQEELDAIIGKERRVTEADLPNLVYLQAIVKETFRLYPPGPLGGQRVFTEDCTIGGYHIPKDTRLLVNLWKIHRDPQVWSEPLEFKPERFLSTHKNVDVKGQNFELTPFGAGRRSCPAINFGLLMVHLTLATFLQAFDFSTVSDELVDMTESPGLINVKATPLQVLVAPRLATHLY